MIVIEETDDETKQQLVEDLEKQNEKLHEDLQDSLSDIWQKIFDYAFILCPVETGTLQSTLRLITNEPASEWTSYSGGGGNKVLTVFDSSIMVGDESVSRPDGYPCIYGQWVHDGHFTPWGTWVEAQPFLEDAVLAFESELEEAIQKVTHELEKGE
jgi:hypothetical protein